MILSSDSRRRANRLVTPQAREMRARAFGSISCKPIYPEDTKQQARTLSIAMAISATKSMQSFLTAILSFIFTFQGQKIIPAESVYAVFEAKQTLNADLVSYAREKCSSVRKLHRTSLPIPHAGGTYEAKTPMPILGGVLTFESDWSPPLGDPLQKALSGGDATSRLDLGCVAAHGMFYRANDKFVFAAEKKPATAFLLELIARLQELATVPMIDVRAYAKWLET
jgi:hypothetical protein